MPDDTNTAIKALIKQVSTLTETVTAQQSTIDGIKQHNDRLLDQIKDNKRATQNPAFPPASIPPGMVQGEDGNWYPKNANPTHSLSRSDARDPVKYHSAKKAAQWAGATLTITDDAPTLDNHRRNTRTPIDTSLKTRLVKDEDRQVAYLRRDDMKDARQYQTLRREGFRCAIVGHVRRPPRAHATQAPIDGEGA
ncbi:hypothetical protein [Vannielia sp. SX4]|uniref:hypothetical protein n=1 Tax=Vannielia sp. SX4 TaxID=3463852 RepID=UPI00405910AE